MKLFKEWPQTTMIFASSILAVVLLVLGYSVEKDIKAKTDSTVENIVVEHTQNGPMSLKTDRNSLFINDFDTKHIPTNVKSTVYFKVPLDEDLQDHIFRLCEEYGVDPHIIFAIIWKESTFKLVEEGDSGESLGLMQVQPKWHQKRMARLNCMDLLDPYQNVTVGIDLFAELMDNGLGLEWSLMAYNGGYSYAHKMTAAGKVSYYANKVIEKSGQFEKYVVNEVINNG